MDLAQENLLLKQQVAQLQETIRSMRQNISDDYSSLLVYRSPERNQSKIIQDLYELQRSIHKLTDTLQQSSNAQQAFTTPLRNKGPATRYAQYQSPVILEQQVTKLRQENDKLKEKIRKKTNGVVYTRSRLGYCSACDHLLALGYSTRYCVRHGNCKRSDILQQLR